MFDHVLVQFQLFKKHNGVFILTSYSKVH